MKGLVTYTSSLGDHEVYSVIAERTLPADGYHESHMNKALLLDSWDLEGPDMPIKRLVLPLGVL